MGFLFSLLFYISFAIETERLLLCVSNPKTGNGND